MHRKRKKHGCKTAKIAQLVEHNLAKVGVAGSSPVFRSEYIKHTIVIIISADPTRENSSVGRAQPCQGWGRGFESRFSLKEETIWALTVEDDKNVRVVELVDTLL